MQPSLYNSTTTNHKEQNRSTWSIYCENNM